MVIIACCSVSIGVGAVAANGIDAHKSAYILYPGDLLQITVFDHPDLTTALRVPENGAVTFPLIGAISGLAGSDLNSITDKIAKALEDGFIRQAIVNATVSEFAPRQLFVMGAVKNQGAIDLNPLTATTVMQAIGKAGGFSEDADRAAVVLMRDDSRSPEGAKASVRIGSGDDGTIHIAHPNDIIIVPRLDRVYIIGQVTKPGSVTMSNEEPLTLSKAITQAGGFDRFAKQSKVQLLRPREKARTIDVREILSGKKNDKVEDPLLKPGDTVFVPESRF